MSEFPAPYGPKRKLTNNERVAAFMNGFLGVEMLDDIQYPDSLRVCVYDDLDEEEQNEWYEYTLNAVFKDAAFQAIGAFGRELSTVELNLIKRRIVNFFIQTGIELNS